MAVYTVHEPARTHDGASPEPERFVFVRDGFSFAAMLFGPLWMLRHWMWLVLLGYGAVVVLLGVVLGLTDASAAVGLSVSVLLALLVGFEAGTLRRFTLARRCFRNVGVVVGDDIELAERRFFDAWGNAATERERAAPSSPVPMAMPHTPRASSDVIGLFPEPGAPR
jgi:hypothetical protein